MAQFDNILNRKQAESACNGKSEDALNNAEHNINDGMLSEMSSAASHYFIILAKLLKPVLNSTTTKATYDFDYGGQGGSSKPENPEFCFEFGLARQGNPSLTVSDFLNDVTLGNQTLASYNFTMTHTGAFTSSVIVNILNYIHDTILRGYVGVSGANQQIPQLHFAIGPSGNGTASKDKEIFAFVGGRIDYIINSLKKAPPEGAGLTEQQVKENFTWLFTKGFKNSPGSGLYHLLRFYPDTSIASVFKSTGSPFPSDPVQLGYDDSKPNKTGFAAKLEKDWDNYQFSFGDLKSKAKWRQTTISRLVDECQTIPQTTGAATYTKQERSSKQLANLKCVLPLLETFYSTKNVKSLDKKLNPFNRDKVAFNARSSAAKRFKVHGGNYGPDDYPFLFLNSDDPLFFINNLFNATKGKDLEAFTRLTNTDVSQLVPKMEISKIEYPKNSAKGVEVPFEFSQEIELTDQQYYNRENAGIQRVTFTMLGKNPAEVDKYIGCEINLFFDSINAFLKPRVSTNGREYSYKDLLMRHTKFKNISDANYAGKLAGSVKRQFGGFKPEITKNKEDIFAEKIKEFNTQLKGIKYLVPNEKYFRIRLDVGWQKHQALSSELQSFLKNSNLSLMLTLQTHSFSFSNDGTITLQLNYMGAVEGQMIDKVGTNIFHSEQLVQATKATTAISQIVSMINSMQADGELLDIAKNLADFRKNILVLLDEQAETKQKQMWEQLTNQTEYMKDMSTGEFTPTHILMGSIPGKYAGFGGNGRSSAKNLLSENQKKALKNKDPRSLVVSPDIVLSNLMKEIIDERKGVSTKNKFSQKVKYSMVERNPGYNPKKPKSGKRFSNIPAAGTPPRSPHYYSERLKKRHKAANHFALSTRGVQDPVNFYFVRYGSILMAALNNIWNSNPDGLRDTVVITGPIKFKSALTGKDQYTNFSHLPILLGSWNQFFQNKVLKEGPMGNVTKNAINYPFMRFFHDTINHLLRDMIHSQCADLTNAFNPLRDINPKIAIFTAKKHRSIRPPKLKPIQKSAWEPNKNWREFNKNINLRKGAAPFSKDIPLGKSSSSKDVKHFIVLYDAGSSDTGVNRTLDDHINNNIMHFFIGANRGILKNIRFDKSDIKGFQEAKVIDEGNIEGGLLREKYDVNVEVVGTSYFMQGMKFYLDPTFVGMSAGSQRTLQEDIGLGGYYVITDVQSSITPDDFSTSLHGSWVNYGNPPKK